MAVRCQENKLSASRNVEAWDASANRAKQVGGNRADTPSHLIGRVGVFAIDAVDGDHVAELRSGNVGSVDHGYVHRHDADDGCEFPAHQHAAASAQRTMYAIAVARCKNSDEGRPRGHEFRAVSDARAGWNSPQADDACAQTHHRLQRQFSLGFGAHFGGIEARMIAVQDYAGPHHVPPGFRPCRDGRTVRQMHDARINAKRA